MFDLPITTGFTVFKSDYRFDQLRQAATFSGLAPNTLQSLGVGSAFQNYAQNSSGFTVFASYPLRRSFARVGVTYSYSISSLEAFSDVSTNFFQALSFRGIEGPNILSGIKQSRIQPSYTYNTTNHPYEPTRGKYFYASVGFSGSVLGGNVNAIRPTVEARYYRPVANKKADRPHVLAIRGLASHGDGLRRPSATAIFTLLYWRRRGHPGLLHPQHQPDFLVSHDCAGVQQGRAGGRTFQPWGRMGKT